MIGCGCESNKDKFYKQTDFAASFSIINGLPVPSASIGSTIPEMFFNMSQQEKLNTLGMVNQRLMNMVESDGSDEFQFQFQKAKLFHQMFANNSNNLNAFQQAEANYLTSSQAISDRLGQRALDVNLFQVLLGLVVNILITATILVPCDSMGKDLNLSMKSFVPFIVGGFVLKLVVFNEIFQQTNDAKSFLVLLLMSSVVRIVLGILHAKIERFKWFQLFDHDLLYLLMLGHFLFVVSVGSSSFVEEEHQIWYYLCNTMFAFLAFFNLRGREDTAAFIWALIKCIPFLVLHIIIRRMNQTGDKWINAPDLGDWLHREANVNYLHGLVILSLVASSAWLVMVHCTKAAIMPFIVIGNVLLYFHHTRSINNR